MENDGDDVDNGKSEFSEHMIKTEIEGKKSGPTCEKCEKDDEF